MHAAQSENGMRGVQRRSLAEIILAAERRALRDGWRASAGLRLATARRNYWFCRRRAALDWRRRKLWGDIAQAWRAISREAQRSAARKATSAAPTVPFARDRLRRPCLLCP